MKRFLIIVLWMMPLAVHAQLVEDLAGASGSTVGPDRALYVTEGAVGKISRIDPQTGAKTTFAEGLPPSRIGIGGAVDIAFIGEVAYVLVTVVGPNPFNPGTDIDGIYRVDGPNEFTVIADIGGFSADNLPTYPVDFVNGVQYAMETYRGGFLVSDGHHNRVVRVTLDGEVSDFRVFGNIVPTGLEVWGKTIYMAQAGPAPHEPADGKVVSFDSKSAAVTSVASGARLLVDVERGRGSTMFALAQGEWNGVFPGSPAIPNDGSLVRVNADGTFTVVFDGLNLPTSMEIIDNTAYVVTLTGTVMKLPDIAEPPYDGL